VIQGVEWIFVAVILLVLVLWEPEKLSEIAKALAKARREYEKASRELQEALAASEEKAVEEAVKASDEKLIEVARSLGIVTEGKTREEIAQAILEKAGVGLNNEEAAEPREPVKSFEASGQGSSHPTPSPSSNTASTHGIGAADNRSENSTGQ